jgi:hypothetical protein
MKYFRIHPDIILIANYPESTHRVRRVRVTTPTQLSKILITAITSALGKTKKILLLTDAPNARPRAGWITSTSWVTGKPYTCLRLVRHLIYNHETRAVCVLYHPELFGRFWTTIFILPLFGFFRLTGKHVTTILLAIPKLPAQPTIVQTIRYFMQFALLIIVTILTHIPVVGEHTFARKLMQLTRKKTIITVPMTFRTLKERKTAGNILKEELFPSPIKNLGLTHYLHPDAGTKPAA